MLINIKNINKFYYRNDEKVQVLKDINLEVSKGEFICFLGPSGCGKTTLLRLIAGLEKPDSGEIYDGDEIVTKPSKDRGFIFQQYSLFPWLTVLDNVMFGLNLTNDSKDENVEAAKRYLERVGLADVANSYPHELSGGMKQRVAIIRSLLNHTPVLLMDEPFSALDMQNRHKLQEQLLGVWKRFENTIIFITHDVDESIFLADRVVVMDKNPGRVKKIVDIDLPRPRNRESIEFLQVQEKVKNLIDISD